MVHSSLAPARRIKEGFSNKPVDPVWGLVHLYVNVLAGAWFVESRFATCAELNSPVGRHIQRAFAPFPSFRHGLTVDRWLGMVHLSSSAVPHRWKALESAPFFLPAILLLIRSPLEVPNFVREAVDMVHSSLVRASRNLERQQHHFTNVVLRPIDPYVGVAGRVRSWRENYASAAAETAQRRDLVLLDHVCLVHKFFDLRSGAVSQQCVCARANESTLVLGLVAVAVVAFQGFAASAS
mmetsp:Transcript_10079/g.25885  ORF Transcript_10079/g.25885 Transcript_10079/m.25885 type:complete len:238 (-) Transcript_10079:40-753(-)